MIQRQKKSGKMCQFLLGTVQPSPKHRRNLHETVSIPLRYGTTFAKTISIATTLIVSIPLRYGTTVVISGHIQTGSYVSIPLRYGTTGV